MLQKDYLKSPTIRISANALQINETALAFKYLSYNMKSLAEKYFQTFSIQETLIKCQLQIIQEQLKILSSYLTNEIKDIQETIRNGFKACIPLIETPIIPEIDKFKDTLSILYNNLYNQPEFLNELCDNEIDCENTPLDDQDVEEFANDIQEVKVLSAQKNWQQKISEIWDKWKDRNPILAFILISIIFPLLLQLFGKFVVNLADNTKIKEKPESTARVIVQINNNQTVYVLDEVPYYFEVAFTDDNGKTYTGWVSKKQTRPFIDEIPDELPEKLSNELKDKQPENKESNNTKTAANIEYVEKID